MDNNYFDLFTLKIESKPVEFHGITVRNNIPKSLWTKIRKEVLAKHNYQCSICGFKPEEKELRYLHVHEIEKYDFDNSICELVDLNLICLKCHSFHHMGRTNSISTKEQLEDLALHFMAVNDCDRIDYESYKLYAGNKMMEERQGRKTISPDDIRFKITGDIPYKKEVIGYLKDECMYIKE